MKIGSLFAVRKLGDSEGTLLENCADKDPRLASLGIYFEEKSSMNDLFKYIHENVPDPDHCMKLLTKSQKAVIDLLIAQSNYGSYTEAVVDAIGSVDKILERFHDDSVVVSFDSPEYDVDDAVIDDYDTEEVREEKVGASDEEPAPYKEPEQPVQVEEQAKDPERDRLTEVHQMVTAISRYLGIDPNAVAGQEEIEVNAVREAVGCIFNASSASLKSALLNVFVNTAETGKDVSLCAHFFAKLIQYMDLDELK